jgi:hypothetical protein
VLSLTLFVAVLLVSTVGPPSGAFDTGTVDRSSAIGVVGDPDGVQQLDVTTALASGSENCLVEVTNRFGQDVTVTVSLHEDSTTYGTLNVSAGGETVSGDTVEFDLPAGTTQTVDMNVETGTAGNTTVFDVTAAGDGLDASTPNRQAPIESTAGTTCD